MPRLTLWLPVLALLGACMPSGWAPSAADLPRGRWAYLQGSVEIACEGYDVFTSTQDGATRDISAGDEGLVLKDHGGDSGDCRQQVFTFTDARHAFIPAGTTCGTQVTILEAQLELLPREKVIYLRRYLAVRVPDHDDPEAAPMACRIFESGYLAAPDEPEPPEVTVVEPETHDVIEYSPEEAKLADDPEPNYEQVPAREFNTACTQDLDAEGHCPGFILVMPDSVL